MRKDVILITGANGEIGHGLITHLGKSREVNIIAIDVQPLDESLRPYCERFFQGDILDNMLLGRLVSEFDIRCIYHLASILSTKAEYNPETAHRVNVEGTLNLLKLAVEQSSWQGQPVKFLYPSSIAAYGLPTLAVKSKAGKVKECEWCSPITMYGCNKLYCEHLGRYYSYHYRQLAADEVKNRVDFRCLRFPGLISSVTTPTGGTSDYGPEMLHNAAQGVPYNCFVRPDSQLPFMVMPDAVRSLLMLANAPHENLNQLVYNVTSFSPTAMEFYNQVAKAFPKAIVNFEPHSARQKIVDTWPADVDDSAATRDWGWKPEYDEKRAFEEYLIPSIKARYAK
ncbi:MAG: NAD-dependent epimerase/dehydratase family protein [Anaerolineaceae bacterium]